MAMLTSRAARFSFALAFAPSIASCTNGRQTGGSQLTASGDTALFAAVVQLLIADTTARVRVDPRPLRPDPELLTLFRVKVDANGNFTADESGPLATVADDVVRARASVLRSLAVVSADAVLDAKCPGLLVPPKPNAASELKRLCPQTEQYRSVIIALPRKGGPYVPSTIAGRDEFAGRDVVSMRVVSRLVTRNGSSEVSKDYVFERMDGVRWRFIVAKTLLIVE